MVSDKNIIFLSTDTNHHRYLIKKFESKKIFFERIFFETTSVKPVYKIEPFEKNKIKNFEKKFFKDFSNRINLEKVKLVKNINSNLVYNYIKKKKPYICVVFGTRKLDERIIKLFKPKTFLINIHRGIMSAYRGLDSDLWAILENRVNLIGITIHEIEKKLDSGKTFYEKKLKVKNLKIHQIKFYTTILAVKYMIILIEKILNGKKIKKRKLKLGNYYTFMPLNLKEICKLKLNNEK